MGCNRGCCRPTGPGPGCDGFAKILLFLVAILILLCIPKLFITYEPAVEPPKEAINCECMVLPLALIAIVYLVLIIGPGSGCKPPPCKRCHRYSCKGCFIGVWRNDYENVTFS